jgi:predicted nucleic acid-binding Zn ribbon protein
LRVQYNQSLIATTHAAGTCNPEEDRRRNCATRRAWPLVCGAKIAERTTAVGFAGGILTVAVPDQAWRRQLQSFLPQYLAALNQTVAEPVADIQFRTVQPKR